MFVTMARKSDILIKLPTPDVDFQTCNPFFAIIFYFVFPGNQHLLIIELTKFVTKENTTYSYWY